MKAKIDKAGLLHLQRAGTWRLQTCPFDRAPGLGSAPSYCGDWCPLFEEWPDHVADEKMLLLRCGRSVGMVVEADERKGKKEPT